MKNNEIEKIELSDLENEYYKRFLHYTPNRKQEAFHAAGLIAQERLITGGNRSGKSHCGQRESIAHWSGIYNENWNGYRFNRPIDSWVIGETSSVVTQTLQKTILGDQELNLRGLLHPDLIKTKKRSGSSEMYRTIYVENSFGGASKITFKTYEEGRESFQGSKVDLILMDEEPPFNIYKECKMRTMATEDGFRGMIIVCSVPLKGFSDFFNYFMDDIHPETVKDSRWYGHIEWDDTQHLSEDEKKRMLASMSPHEIEARTKGIPWSGSGLVYPVPESMLIYDPFEIPNHWARVYSIDFGWNHPAFLFAAHDRDNNTWYFYAEYSVPQRTPDGHASALQSFGINWIPAVYDPAGKGSQTGDGKKPINLYREAGFKNLFPANNSKDEGIQKTLQMMQAGQIKIASNLVKTLSELRKYARDEDGIPYKKDDHFMDCMRYIVMSGGGVSIPKNFEHSQYEGRYSNEEPSYF